MNYDQMNLIETNNTTLRQEKIQSIKKELAKKYIIVMCSVLFCFIFYFVIYVESVFIIYYLIFGIVTLGSLWIVFNDRIKLEKMIRSYLIIAPLYNLVVMLQFWNYSVVSFVWLVPMPIGAYVYFSIKDVISYSLYAFVTIVVAILLANQISIIHIDVTNYKLRLADISLIIANISIATLILYYKNKIRRLEIISELEKKEKIELPVSLDKEEMKMYHDIFLRIESLMTERQVFKDSEFNISTLSLMLNVSNSYVSRAIRYQDYPNFNNYVNYYRIEYVIKLIKTVDFEKITMVYIYTEAGYKNQSTFNRAFKEQKGITPSVFVKSLTK